MSDRARLARKIYETAHLTGEFRLRSGVTSTEYFDKYLFEGDPTLLADIAEAMAPMVPPAVEALAGLELGGVPLVTMLSQLTGLPALFVRKKAKDYGTCRLAEGGDVQGRQILIVEDVVTSGGAVVDAWRELEALGAKADSVICVIDRESGGSQNLDKVGLRLSPLFRMSELEAAASPTGGS